MPREYYRSPAMYSGEFRCFNCDKKLIVAIRGAYELKMECPRCKATMTVVTREPIPYAIDKAKEGDQNLVGAASDKQSCPA